MNLQQFNNIEISDPVRINNLVINVMNKHAKGVFTPQHLVVTVHPKDPILYKIPVGMITSEQMSDISHLNIN